MRRFTLIALSIAIVATAGTSALASAQEKTRAEVRQELTSDTSQLASRTQTVASVAPPWAPSSAAGKTRAQVYQELVQARQDGEMEYLKQLYKGR
jgi:hypothetical protein